MLKYLVGQALGANKGEEPFLEGWRGTSSHDASAPRKTSSVS